MESKNRKILSDVKELFYTKCVFTKITSFVYAKIQKRLGDKIRPLYRDISYEIWADLINRYANK